MRESLLLSSVSWTGQARKIQVKVLTLMGTKALNTALYSVSLQFAFFFFFFPQKEVSFYPTELTEWSYVL